MVFWSIEGLGVPGELPYDGAGEDVVLRFEMPLVDARDFRNPCAVGAGDADRDPALKVAGGAEGDHSLPAAIESSWAIIQGDDTCV